MKLRDKLDTIKRTTPKRSLAGQLYRLKAETQRAYKKIKLITLFYSHEGSQMIREHIFESSDRARTPVEWNEWFNELVNEKNGRSDEPRTIKRLTYIQVHGVLPGLAKRTQKRWAVRNIIGWVGSDIHKPKRAVQRRGRNKTKSKGRKNG